MKHVALTTTAAVLLTACAPPAPPPIIDCSVVLSGKAGELILPPGCETPPAGRQGGTSPGLPDDPHDPMMPPSGPPSAPPGGNPPPPQEPPPAPPSGAAPGNPGNDRPDGRAGEDPKPGEMQSERGDIGDRGASN